MKTRYANILMTVAIPLAGLLLVVAAASCSKQPGDESAEPPASKAAEVATTAVAPAAVNTQRIINADQEPGNWMSHGRSYDEQRFSPLRTINDGNADRLGLSWYFDIPTRRGMQATPLMVDGVLYVSSSWSLVYAFNAAPRIIKGKVIIGNGGSEFGVRGYVSAYDAATGAMAWRFYTVPGDPSQPFENPILEMAAAACFRPPAT